MSRTSETPSPFTSQPCEDETHMRPKGMLKVGQARIRSPLGSATMVSPFVTRNTWSGVLGAIA